MACLLKNEPASYFSMRGLVEETEPKRKRVLIGRISMEELTQNQMI